MMGNLVDFSKEAKELAVSRSIRTYYFNDRREHGDDINFCAEMSYKMSVLVNKQF